MKTMILIIIIVINNSTRFKFIYFHALIIRKFEINKNYYARDGDRTHAHIRELDLKSNALTTRPPWHAILRTLSIAEG